MVFASICTDPGSTFESMVPPDMGPDTIPLHHDGSSVGLKLMGNDSEDSNFVGNS